MKKISMLFFFLTSFARDPFCYPDGKHQYKCSAIGCINERPVFARISIDGRESLVRIGDKLLGHEVLAIGKNVVLIKDPLGTNHSLGLPF